MRANAFLQRAARHREKLQTCVDELTAMVPSAATLQALYTVAQDEPVLTTAILRRVLQDTAKQERQFRRTQYRHGLYQYALLQAAQDSLRATELLPSNAATWQRAAFCLSELWKLQESTQYYERAMELDDSVVTRTTLYPIIDQLRRRKELLDNARAYGWSEDTLRLALDVASR